ncbi:hypothetical protein TNCV_3785381 [Trichonephila clavipes]|nr:hypothetical protein TNCV_3785381 [Trichonephila clavipes]
MDKFLSRKRTFDDNKASTSAQTSIVTKIKSRKYSQEYLNFEFAITEVNGDEKPLCVIWSKILAADSMKPNKLKRHFETLHVVNCYEIVTSVQAESDTVDDETDEDEDNDNIESSKGPSNADECSTFETAMEWYEQQS